MEKELAYSGLTVSGKLRWSPNSKILFPLFLYIGMTFKFTWGNNTHIWSNIQIHMITMLALTQNYFQALLQLLGYSRPGPQPSKPALRSPGEGGGEKGRKVGDIMFCFR